MSLDRPSMKIDDHEDHNMPEPEHDGTQVADVVPLHPPGTFNSNTQIGDAVNGLAKALGVKPPNNVVKFPRK